MPDEVGDRQDQHDGDEDSEGREDHLRLLMLDVLGHAKRPENWPQGVSVLKSA